MDSAVEGLEVLQKGKSLGKTNAKGEFNYNTADGKVTFKLGELALGETEPKSIITPTDLTKKEAESTRILQILQSADTDNNPDNGIKIEEKVAKRFKPDDLKDLVQQSKDNEFEQKLKTRLDTNQYVQTKEKAQEHFYETLQSEQVAHASENIKLADKFVGSWEQGCDHGGKEVFQLVKSPSAPNTLVSTGRVLTKRYQNKNCTGNYTESSYNGSQTEVIRIVGDYYNDNNKQVIRVYSQEHQAPRELVWVDDNKYRDEVDNITFTRVF
ncbi:hypothetical protein MOMA_02345 [Moraxella macacae 0408225]|uniref:Uncharacterized protein n=1 Tax=Moraxella macacae 0408225 TaxID=1230338 RepID=L2F9R3_9GAMM|nr:hypothetical protein [Moraxella macacae]ELA09208.1 hypothetical protein MOMA_02345 [Moraxella macacae 0408225]